MEEILAGGKRKLVLIKGDLTDLDVEAIVYYAEPDLVLGAGFGTAISVRGGPGIRKELEGLGPLKTGQVAVTAAGKLKAGWIFHAVGPRFQEAGTEEKLRLTIANVLREASSRGIRSLAFPPMGAGFYGIPLEMCARVMVENIRTHLAGETSLEKAIICVLDNREFHPFRQQLQTALEEAVQ